MTSTESTFSPELDAIVGDLNMALQQYVLECLRVHRYKPKVKYTGDEYFIFSGYPNSIMHFTMSRTPGWLWGCWVNGESMESPDEPAIQLFCQHKTNIDKFKPSASDCKIEITFRELHDVMYNDYVTKYVNEPWSMRKIAALADFVRMHPFLAYAGECDDYLPMGFHPTADMVYGVARWARDGAAEIAVRRLAAVSKALLSKSRLVEKVHASEWAYPTSCLTVVIKEGVDSVPNWMGCREVDILGKTLRIETVSHDGEWEYK